VQCEKPHLKQRHTCAKGTRPIENTSLPAASAMPEAAEQPAILAVLGGAIEPAEPAPACKQCQNPQLRRAHTCAKAKKALPHAASGDMIQPCEVQLGCLGGCSTSMCECNQLLPTDINCLPMTKAAITNKIKSLPKVKQDGTLISVAEDYAVEHKLWRIKYPEDPSMPFNEKPDPAAHFQRGLEVIGIRWELSYPGDPKVLAALRCVCPTCCEKEGPLGASLLQTKGRWGSRLDNSGTKTVFTMGRPAKVVEWVYGSEIPCHRTYHATDPDLINRLPPRCRHALPFNPHWSNQIGRNWYLSDACSEDVEQSLVTDQSVKVYMEKMTARLRVMWKKHRNSYDNHCDEYIEYFLKTTLTARWQEPPVMPAFPDFNAWIGRPGGLPTGEQLREAHHTAYRAIGGAGTRESIHGYRKRQLQGVVCDANTPVSIDHTYSAAKNFDCGRMVFNAVTGFTVPLLCLLVDGGGIEEYIHALEDLAHRPGWAAPVVYSDNWPSNRVQLEAILGCPGKLGIFHFMKRISDTLRPSHPDYNAATRALSQCIFSWREVDVVGVKGSLKADPPELGHPKLKTHSDAEIEEMIQSGVFKNRYDRFIRTETWPESEI